MKSATTISLTKKNKKIIKAYVQEKGCSLGYFLEESAMMRIERERKIEKWK